MCASEAQAWDLSSHLGRRLHLLFIVFPLLLLFALSILDLESSTLDQLMLLSSTFGEFLGGSLLDCVAAAAPPDAAAAARPPFTAYLAQCPIMAVTPGGGELAPGPLAALAADAPLPAALAGRALTQINFWACLEEAHSSCHYDPYHNVLCCVAGAKTVRLLPPTATGTLAAQPAFHESANHSPVDLAEPDLRAFPRLAAALPDLRSFALGPGDALFIPEGWWHQVESAPGTLAVNHWRVGGRGRHLCWRRPTRALLACLLLEGGGGPRRGPRSARGSPAGALPAGGRATRRRDWAVPATRSCCGGWARACWSGRRRACWPACSAGTSAHWPRRPQRRRHWRRWVPRTPAGTQVRRGGRGGGSPAAWLCQEAVPPAAGSLRFLPRTHAAPACPPPGPRAQPAAPPRRRRPA